MSKFVNPFSDYGWKLIFGSELSKDLIISFLNEVIQQEVIVDDRNGKVGEGTRRDG